MELNFCYHRSLKLTSPLSLSSHRTHFLGCVHTLRPPSTVSPQLRNRNKRSRLGLLPLRSSRFVFKASLQSHPLIVVVVVVTLSAVSLLHFTRNKKKKTLNQTQGHAKFALSPQGSNVGSQVIDSQILGFPEFQRDSPLNEIGKLNDHKGEDKLVFQDQEVPLQYLKSSMVQEAALKTKTSDSSFSVFDSSVNNNSSEVLNESFLSAAFQTSSLEPLAFAEEMALQVEENQDEVDSDPELPLNMVESEHNASLVGVNDAHATINGHTKEKIDPVISNDVLFGESVREGLYMFYEDNKSATGSMTPLSSVKSFSPRASFTNRKGFPSGTGNTTLNGLGLSTDISLQSAEYVEGGVNISSHKEGYSLQHFSKNLRKASRYPRDRERNYMDRDCNKEVLPQSAHRIRAHVDQKNDQISHDGQTIDPSEHLSKYNNLLKAGR